MRNTAKWISAAFGAAAGAYATSVALAWVRYGRVKTANDPSDADPLLDEFMPVYEAIELHRLRVAAPADVTFSAVSRIDLQESALIRALFKTRAAILGAKPDERLLPQPFLEQMQAIGWGVLAELPGREVILGSVTQPWEANVVFRAIPAADFAAFDEPGYVKIVTTLRADPLGPDESIARTETRVATTDPSARAKFRRYWAAFHPGIFLIRRILLSTVKQEAERRVHSKPARASELSRAGQGR
jgi:hypothetical protein